MLYKEAVDASTLELLKSLQSKHYMQGFNLVGGTAVLGCQHAESCNR